MVSKSPSELPETVIDPHAPFHKFSFEGSYIVTASTHHRQLLFRGAQALDHLTSLLHQKALKYRWVLDAWAIFPNHYHFVAHPLGDPRTLSQMVKELHGASSFWLNRVTGQPGRKVWFQYWDTQLTYNESYLARLKYVQQNPVRHGLVESASDYRWCSESYFRESAPKGFQRSLERFKIDRVQVIDDFDLSGFAV